MEKWKFHDHSFIVVTKDGQLASNGRTNWTEIDFGKPFGAIAEAGFSKLRIRMQMIDANDFFWPYIDLKNGKFSVYLRFFVCLWLCIVVFLHFCHDL